ncbi:TetR/AcrR family transcriptional regulator [Streptomyces sp. G45]|uniref:TetR/AcrR family transcriptional regulator n=1 Tax=Streptomyces sp. G45 TaxID=3406627 RepID=UPI003C206535
MRDAPRTRDPGGHGPGRPAGPDGAALRRAPVQRRSAERLSRILDACAALLDEVGYDGLTTRGVAARAGVPIGSVYRFFGNKRALVDALAHRNLDAYAHRVAARLADTPRGDLRGAADAAFDEYLLMKRTVPGFGRVDFGVPAAPGVLPDANATVADRVARLLAGHLGRPADARLRRAVLVSVEAVDALLQLAFRDDPLGSPELIAETRVLLHAYLERTLD